MKQNWGKIRRCPIFSTFDEIFFHLLKIDEGMCVNYANDIRDGNHGENTMISRCVKPAGAKVHHAVWWMDFEICEVQTPFKLSSKVKKI